MSAVVAEFVRRDARWHEQDISFGSLAEVYRLFVFGGMAVNAGVVADGQDERDQIAAREAAQLARVVENAVEVGLGKTLAEHFGPIDCRR